MRDGAEMRAGDVLIAREAVEYLRSLHKPSASKTLLYVQRNHVTAPVRLTNGDEVIKVFRAAGFTVVEPEKMTLAEQQTIFGAAKVVAGESGAALTNMLWAPKDAVMICLTSKAYPLSVYADLTGHAGQRATFLVGEPEREDVVQIPFRMDTIALSKQLREVLAHV
jgi:capsular polysaccharide biosynthesis protein